MAKAAAKATERKVLGRSRAKSWPARGSQCGHARVVKKATMPAGSVATSVVSGLRRQRLNSLAKTQPKMGGGSSGKGKGQAAAKESKEEKPRQRVEREGGEAMEEEDKVGSAAVQRRLGGEVVPFKRDLQQALLHKQRVEARVQQANEVLEDLRRQRQELDEEVEEWNKRVEEVQGQLAVSEEEVQALTTGTSECHWCHWRPPCCWCFAWGARWGTGSSDQVKVKLGGESQRAQKREAGPEVMQEAKAAC
jgi:hypothetical protein